MLHECFRQIHFYVVLLEELLLMLYIWVIQIATLI